MSDELVACLLDLTPWMDAASFVALAFPALAVARLAARTAAFVKQDLDPERVHQVFLKSKKRSDSKAWQRVSEWKPWHNYCLYIGLFIAALSHATKIILG